jgi:crotonobetaine/carnitine-CoA ligase
VGIPFELGEEDVKVVVVLKEGEKLSPEELLDFCQERMAYFMVPRYVEFKDSIPKTGTHRPIYPELKKEGVTPNTWDREQAGYKLKR